MGFAVPLTAWFRGPLKQRVESALKSELIFDSGIFNPDYINKILRDHMNQKYDYGVLIWTLLMYEAFQRKVLA